MGSTTLASEASTVNVLLRHPAGSFAAGLRKVMSESLAGKCSFCGRNLGSFPTQSGPNGSDVQGTLDSVCVVFDRGFTRSIRVVLRAGVTFGG